MWKLVGGVVPNTPTGGRELEHFTTVEADRPIITVPMCISSKDMLKWPYLLYTFSKLASHEIDTNCYASQSWILRHCAYTSFFSLWERLPFLISSVVVELSEHSQFDLVVEMKGKQLQFGVPELNSCVKCLHGRYLCIPTWINYLSSLVVLRTGTTLMVIMKGGGT